MSNESLEHLFPGLAKSEYSITSPQSTMYNCIAWVASDAEAWWEPDMMNNYFWPADAPREYTIDAYGKAYETLGFRACEHAEREEGFEKVAIYVGPDGEPTHAARQLESGRWTSKLGKLEDIEHADLEGLDGAEYGTVGLVMKRPLQHKRVRTVRK
jgi:hypothetical protein